MKDPDIHNQQQLNVPKAELLERCQRRTQFFEVLTVLMAAGSVCLGVFKYDSPWMLFLAGVVLMGAAVPLHFAIVNATKAAVLARSRASSSRYALTRQRVRTLRFVNASEDAIEALEEIRKELPKDERLTEKELITRLAAELGSERMKEVKDIILKYTRVDDADLAAGSNSKPPNTQVETQSKPVAMASAG